MKLAEIELADPKIILLGQFGTGKTCLASTLGEGCLYLDLDGGLRASATLKDQFQAMRAKIEVVQILERDPRSPTVLLKVKEQVSKLLDLSVKGTLPWKYIVIDGYTNLAESAIRWVQKANGLIGKPLQIQHWGMAFMEIEEVLQQLRAIPIVFVLIAHTHREVSDDEGVKYEILTPGQKLKDKVPGYFDEAWMMKVTGSGTARRYAVMTQSTGMYNAKTRGQLADNTDANKGMVEILRSIGWHDKALAPVATSVK